MTKILYFDCFSGIAGDMILGSLIDLGVDEKFLKKELERLPLAGYGLSVKQVESHHIRAVDVTVTITQEQCQRNLFDLFTMLEESTLEKEVVKSCKLIFQRLAHAESKIHGISVEEVHFHEVGAVDSIIDIVGSVIGLKSLDVGEMYCSPLPLGRGFVTCAHGVLPLPAPATMELLKDVPVYSVDRSQELVTPTGAAIVTTLASGFGGMPSMVVKKIGYGNGKIPSEYPSVLRAVLGESSSKSVQEQGSGTKQEKMKRGKKDH
jgi:uncharacterized protein (TIGR00299 family) protein